MIRRFHMVAASSRVLRRRMVQGCFATGNLLLFFAALPVTPASAVGPRDEVIAGMFRCAAVGDVRIWLDCFYGAAQPMRAALGLPPVLPAQARLAQNPPAGVPSGDQSPRYQTTGEVLRCNNLGADRQWLDCYYAAAQPVRAQLGLSPAPQVRTPLPVQEAATASGNHGVARPTPPVAFPISAHMASYSFNRYGLFTVVLANGQAWRQISGDTSTAHWTKPAAGYTVQISRGALRSFNLKVKGSSNEYKVERVDRPE